MEFSHITMFTLLVFVCSGIFSVSGLNCYVCNSINPGESDCDKIPEGSTKYLQNCTENTKSCRIQLQWVDYTVLNQTTPKRTIRQCANVEFTPDRPCYYRAGFGGKVNVCHCNKDSCNEASNQIASLVVIASSFFLIFKVLN